MEFVETQAIYQQVADHVCEKILRGEWPEGERIPSVREMAMELQVNPNTVNKAYAYLQDRELIHNQRGIGYFASDGSRGHTRALKRDEFFADELPRVFRTMTLLGVQASEIVERFNTYQQGARDEEANE